MKITDRQEQEIRRVIRDAIAIDPLITTRRLVAYVEKKLGRTLDFTYLGKLIRKVNREMVPNLDKEKIEYRVKDLRENYRITRERLLRIAFGEVLFNETGIPMIPTIGEQIRAWEAIGRLGKNLLEMEMDLGVFTRHIGEVDLNLRNKTIDEATRAKMFESWKRWFSVKGEVRKIETELPKIANEQSKQPTSPVTGHPQRITAVRDAGLVASD